MTLRPTDSVGPLAALTARIRKTYSDGAVFPKLQQVG
jgi:hypothetical protein